MENCSKDLKYALSGRMQIHPRVLQDIGPLGPMSCSHSTSSAITPSRASGTADHVQSLDDLLSFSSYKWKRKIGFLHFPNWLWPMDINGHHWTKLNIHGHQWTLMDINGHGWTSMDIFKRFSSEDNFRFPPEEAKID